MSGMRVRIHRGAAEIGGSCVEVSSGDATILLDLGRPLWAGRDDEVPLPAAIGLGEPGPAPLAVLLSHGHADHWGLVGDLPAGIPIWIGHGAADVLRAAAFWGTGIDLHETGHLHDHEPLQIGPFKITPFLADHSGFDAYSLLVEAAGSRLFYSGDFRGHGRKHRAFDRLLAHPPTAVDVMLMEGTNLRATPYGTADGASAVVTESGVEDALVETISGTDGLVVVLASAQNIDRLVTVYRATLRTGRRLGVDLYTAEVSDATGWVSIPRVSREWPKVAAYLPLQQRIRVKEAQVFTRTDAVRHQRIFDEQLAAGPGEWVLFGAYQGHVRHLLKDGLLTGGAVVWSMWDGYLSQQGPQHLVAGLAAAGVPFVHHHTSGHASPPDLARLAAAINPGVVVPIHTEAPDRFAEVLGRPVTMHPDGQWWEV